METLVAMNGAVTTHPLLLAILNIGLMDLDQLHQPHQLHQAQLQETTFTVVPVPQTTMMIAMDAVNVIGHGQLVTQHNGTPRKPNADANNESDLL